MMKKCVYLLCITMLLSGCATQIQGPKYQSLSPAFDLFSFFDGEVKAWGLVQNRSGELVQQFTVDITGRIEGNRLTLDETFTYGLGEGVRERTWQIQRLDDGTYLGSAGDVLDSAVGRSFGNAFHWTYRMDLPVGDRSFEVRFEDWFWALDADRLMNRSYLQKFGFDVAEVTIFMERASRK